jgi:hypothetical protein
MMKFRADCLICKKNRSNELKKHRNGNYLKWRAKLFFKKDRCTGEQLQTA